MVKSDKSIELPMPAWTKKHGYITWNKKDDDAIHQIFGEQMRVELSIMGNQLKTRKIERKYRRIGIGYAITRSLSHETTKVILMKTKGNVTKVDFK